ncbi:MAG: amino acid synthesis family protein [Candidatus Hecatellales archaeon]|nr:MAG: amino acid synthesis family protein [Candidatus Hecatellales archaeon]
MEIRKLVVTVEETRMEAGKKLEKPVRKAAAIAVIKNPFAGRYVEDLSILYDYGEKLADILTRKALEALNITPEEAKEKIDNYGKGAIIGMDGELEHGHAILHPKLGKPLRELLGGVDYCKAIIPSAAKMGGPGTALDVPLHYKRAAFVRSHYDAMEVRVPDAPKPDEILVAIVLTDSGRPLPRIGGLKKEEVKGLDGLR